LGELAEFNQETGHTKGTESKVLLDIRTISKQRIIKPKTRYHTKLNIGAEKLKLIEDELIKLIKS
jgi:hypothetical protein